MLTPNLAEFHLKHKVPPYPSQTKPNQTCFTKHTHKPEVGPSAWFLGEMSWRAAAVVKAGSFFQQDNSQLSLKPFLSSLLGQYRQPDNSAIHLLPFLLSNVVEMQQRSNKARILFALHRVLARRQAGRPSESVSVRKRAAPQGQCDSPQGGGQGGGAAHPPLAAAPVLPSSPGS